MSEPKRPGNLAHLERMLDQWSRSDAGQQATVGRLRRMVATSVLAAMLDGLDDHGVPRLAFKGGAGLEFRFGVSARATRDVDALVNVSIGEALELIRERLVIGWEGFTGSVGEPTEITRAGIVPAPQRCKIKLLYKAKPFVTLDFEFGRSEPEVFELLELVPNAVPLERVLLAPGMPVLLLNVHFQIAQKLHACTEVPILGSNHRVHDLYDILLLEPLARHDGIERTREACVLTFDYRKRHAWPPPLVDWPDWRQLWDALDIPDGHRIDYGDARKQIEELIAVLAG